MRVSRRKFIKGVGTTAAGALLAGMPKGWAGPVFADDTPETKTVRFGIIALTDCSSIVMAH
jgi:nitrate/nitrite transport system substrate-binding protein